MEVVADIEAVGQSVDGSHWEAETTVECRGTIDESQAIGELGVVVTTDHIDSIQPASHHQKTAVSLGGEQIVVGVDTDAAGKVGWVSGDDRLVGQAGKVNVGCGENWDATCIGLGVEATAIAFDGKEAETESVRVALIEPKAQVQTTSRLSSLANAAAKQRRCGGQHTCVGKRGRGRTRGHQRRNVSTLGPDVHEFDASPRAVNGEVIGETGAKTECTTIAGTTEVCATEVRATEVRATRVGTSAPQVATWVGTTRIGTTVGVCRVSDRPNRCIDRRLPNWSVGGEFRGRRDGSDAGADRKCGVWSRGSGAHNRLPAWALTKTLLPLSQGE